MDIWHALIAGSFGLNIVIIVMLARLQNASAADDEKEETGGEIDPARITALWEAIAPIAGTLIAAYSAYKRDERSGAHEPVAGPAPDHDGGRRPPPQADSGPRTYDADTRVKIAEAGKVIVQDDLGNDIVMEPDGITPCRTCDKAMAEAWKSRTESGKVASDNGKLASGKALCLGLFMR